MSITARPLRYAHSEGHTDVCYSEDGRQLITCGIDGDVRIWAGIEDTDPESYCVGEGIFGVAQKGDDIYVGRADGRVIIVKFPEGERSGFLTRFTAAATHVAVAKDESLIACVSEDFSVKVFKNAQDVDVQFSDLKGPALGVTISNDGMMLAASCGDGNIYIWNVEEKKLLKSINCIPKCNSFTSAKVLGRGSFDSKRKYFAYPHDKEIVIVNVGNDIEKVFSLTSNQIQTSFSIAQFSPCDNYIAASSTNGEIYIWRCQSGSEAVVQPHEQKYSICALTWNPVEKGEIAFCDISGQVGTVDYLSGEADLVSEANDVEVPELMAIDMDDEDDENVISLDKLKNDTMGAFGHLSPSNVSSRSASRSRAQSAERSRSPPCTLQPPFQPGSTPHHLTQRFMAFNEIGIVRLHNDEDGTSSIDVQFHEAAFFKNLYIKNHLNHTMASLSSGVLALACETPSKLVCIPLKTGIKEWSFDMTDLEEILCIASSSSLVAVATNVRMLRIFSIFGMQRAVISIPGPVVCAAAYKDYSCVIYHACTAHSKDQNLSAMLVHVNGTNITSKNFPIPITPQTNLSWIGFTDAGSLASYDSGGILRICKLQSEAWIPACDTAVHLKGASSSYFMIHVSEKSQTIRVIHCKGAMYPAATPLPLLIEFPMQVPMCEMETDKTQMEEKFFRWCFFEAENPDKLFKETALKLFALACNDNLDDRAFDILVILDNPQLIQIALKYANKLNKQRLTMKITEYLAKLQGEKDKSKTETSANKTIRPIPTRKPRPIERPEPRLPEPSNLSEPASQAEMFTPDLSISNTTLNESQLKDVTFIPKTKKNPFVIKTASVETKRNPFSLTNPVQTPLDSTFGPIEVQHGKPPQNQNKSITKDSFTTWYNEQKPILEKEHSNVSPTDLVKLALKLYKSQAEKRKGSDDIEKEAQKPKQAKLNSFAFVKR